MEDGHRSYARHAGLGSLLTPFFFSFSIPMGQKEKTCPQISGTFSPLLSVFFGTLFRPTAYDQGILGTSEGVFDHLLAKIGLIDGLREVFHGLTKDVV